MPIVLNVGGTKFEASLETLKQNPGPRDKNTLANLNYVEGEEVCIDRDPKHFDSILKYLEDGSVSISEDVGTLAQIKREAQFYGLYDLAQRIENLISRVLMASIPFDVLRSLTPGEAFAIRRTVKLVDGMIAPNPRKRVKSWYNEETNKANPRKNFYILLHSASLPLINVIHKIQ